MITELTLEMKSGILNQIYDKVKNCKVVKPPYELDNGIYNQDFFLDKRDGLEWFKENSGFTYTDIKNLNGINHYLYNNGTQCFVGIENGNTITQIAGPFNIDSDSPIKLVEGFGAYGGIITSGSITNPVSSSSPTADLAYYGDGWVKLTLSSVTGVSIGQYIQFQDGALKGSCNKIYHIIGNDIYIIGTNSRGSLPLSGGSYKIFPSIKENIVLGCSSGLYLLTLNGISTSSQLQINTEKVYDVVGFNGAIFVLYQNNILFSRRKFDDNVGFYPLDKFVANGILKLIDLGKILLAIGNINRIYSPATNTDNTIGYVEYSVNYQGTIYDKYSYIYEDSTFYIIQKDRQIMQINVITVNSTTYDLETKAIDYNTRGIFEGVSGGNFFVNANDRFINFCNIIGNKTIIYEYDKQYQHWLIHEFDKKIYYYGDKVLLNGGIAIRGGTTDLGIEFNQEVNFMISEKNKLIMPLLIRTNFGLTGKTKIDLKLDITYSEGSELVKSTKYYKDYAFDATLTNNEIQDLIGFEEDIKYTGNTVSLQKNIIKSGRFFWFKFYSQNRFIIGETYIPYKKSKFYINEILQSN